MIVRLRLLLPTSTCASSSKHVSLQQRPVPVLPVSVSNGLHPPFLSTSAIFLSCVLCLQVYAIWTIHCCISAYTYHLLLSQLDRCNQALPMGSAFFSCHSLILERSHLGGQFIHSQCSRAALAETRSERRRQCIALLARSLDFLEENGHKQGLELESTHFHGRCMAERIKQLEQEVRYHRRSAIHRHGQGCRWQRGLL